MSDGDGSADGNDQCCMIGCENTAIVEVRERRGTRGGLRKWMPYCSVHKEQKVRTLDTDTDREERDA